jgi:transposase
VCFLAALRKWVQENGSQNVIYFDESGFANHSYRPHGWARRGVKNHGKVSENNRKSVNLIMAQRCKEWLAPMLFKGSCTHRTVSAWIEAFLLKELHEPSLIIMDNAPFHNKPQMQKLFEGRGHTMLPRPKYSPDFNPIEQFFAIIKRRRMFSEKTLDEILMGNC